MNYLKELKTLAKDSIILCTGDVLHSYDQPPELLNLLMKNMPMIFSIPGNHDMPEHSYLEMERSAYTTLVHAGLIINLEKRQPYKINGETRIIVFPFGHGSKITPCPETSKKVQKIALVHEYVWSEGHTHPGAPQSQHVSEFAKRCAGYDWVFVGDNHSPFIYKNIINCGGFMNRSSDEKDKSCYAYRLQGNNPIKSVKLDRSQDRWRDKEVSEKIDSGIESSIDAEQLIETLIQLGSDSINFANCLTRHLDKIGADKSVRKLVNQIMEESKNGP